MKTSFIINHPTRMSESIIREYKRRNEAFQDAFDKVVKIEFYCKPKDSEYQRLVAERDRLQKERDDYKSAHEWACKEYWHRKLQPGGYDW